jgi:hypothetical protein
MSIEFEVLMTNIRNQVHDYIEHVLVECCKEYNLPFHEVSMHVFPNTTPMTLLDTEQSEVTSKPKKVPVKKKTTKTETVPMDTASSQVPVKKKTTKTETDPMDTASSQVPVKKKTTKTETDPMDTASSQVPVNTETDPMDTASSQVPSKKKTTKPKKNVVEKVAKAKLSVQMCTARTKNNEPCKSKAFGSESFCKKHLKQPITLTESKKTKTPDVGMDDLPQDEANWFAESVGTMKPDLSMTQSFYPGTEADLYEEESILDDVSESEYVLDE